MNADFTQGERRFMPSSTHVRAFRPRSSAAAERATTRCPETARPVAGTGSRKRPCPRKARWRLRPLPPPPSRPRSASRAVNRNEKPTIAPCRYTASRAKRVRGEQSRSELRGAGNAPWRCEPPPPKRFWPRGAEGTAAGDNLSDPENRACPGEAGAEGCEEQVRAVLHAAFLVRFVQRHRDRRGGRVAVLLDVVDDLLVGELEPRARPSG